MQNDSHYNPIAIRRSLHAGNVYLTFGGDHEKPFMFGKVINADGENLWLRLFFNNRSYTPPFTRIATVTSCSLAYNIRGATRTGTVALPSPEEAASSCMHPRFAAIAARSP